MTVKRKIIALVTAIFMVAAMMPAGMTWVFAEEEMYDISHPFEGGKGDVTFDQNYRVLDQIERTPYDDYFYIVPAGTELEPIVKYDGADVDSQYYEATYAECMFYTDRNEWDKIEPVKWIDHFPSKPGVYFCKVEGKDPYCGTFEWIDLIRISGAIKNMDIGNVWTDLSPIKAIPFTTAFDPDGILDSKVEFKDQYWKDVKTGKEIHIGSSSFPEAGHTYKFCVQVAPIDKDYTKKGYYYFDNEPFDEFIYGGSAVPADQYNKTLNEDGSITLDWGLTSTCAKKSNPLSVKPKTAPVKYKSLKKKNQSLKAAQVIKFVKTGQGTMSYTKASGNKKITINKKNGKVTIKKGLKKGTYKVRVNVKAAGNETYKPSAVKSITFKIKVK